ncbi:hypothetical protein CDN99_18600 [Roseateles aquatilis]|uniref:Sodium symporter small subunit domain-containing protein n=1 Tax=Roseateles aquatilis TaxID=431061 RepID=A0A246J4S6_9BURK|nr:DUF4212 domain-containing protein [Roseateles aquatilis]OWQ87601.1 hypothetical protein CDN99_18600 [Roseateles aquatilis]
MVRKHVQPVPQAGYPEDPSERRVDGRRRFWRGTWRLTLALLTVWALVTFGVAYFARALSFDFFGWPFSFWVGSQGALIVYVAIVVVYARVMNRREAEAIEAGDPPQDQEASPSSPHRTDPITGF